MMGKLQRKLKLIKLFLQMRMLEKERRKIKRRNPRINNREAELLSLCKVSLLSTTNLTVPTKRIHSKTSPKKVAMIIPSKTSPRKVVKMQSPFPWIGSKLTGSIPGSSRKKNSEKWKKKRRNCQLPNSFFFVSKHLPFCYRSEKKWFIELIKKRI